MTTDTTVAIGRRSLLAAAGAFRGFAAALRRGRCLREDERSHGARARQ